MVVLRDQEFPVNGGNLEFDFMSPDGEGPFPLVIFLHGGGWISGDKTMFRDEAVWLSRQGFACACTSYRLAPLYPFPIPISDCQNFVDYIRQNSEMFRIDTENIVAVGNSAGGHLALMLGLCPKYLDSGEPFTPVETVVSVCGISDICQSEANFELSMTFIEQFMDCRQAENPSLWQEASPIHYVDTAKGRFLLIHGSDDDVVPCEQSRKLANELQANGQDVEFIELSNELHSFSYSAWEKIRDSYVAFLEKRVRVQQ